jgi:hypothetical protein
LPEEEDETPADNYCDEEKENNVDIDESPEEEDETPADNYCDEEEENNVEIDELDSDGEDNVLSGDENNYVSEEDQEMNLQEDELFYGMKRRR